MNNDAAFFALEAALPPELAPRFKAHEDKIRAVVRRVPLSKVSPLLEQKQVYFVRKALARWDKTASELSREHSLSDYGPDNAEDIAAAITEDPAQAAHLARYGVDWIRAAEILAALLKDTTRQEEPKGTVLWTTAPAAYDFASTWRSADKATVFGSSYTRVVVRDTPQGAHEVQHQLNRYASGGQGTMTDAEMQKELEIEARKAKLEPHRAEFQEMRADVQTAARGLMVVRDRLRRWKPGVEVREVYDPKLGRNTYVSDNTQPDLPTAVSLLESVHERFKRASTEAKREFDSAGDLAADISALLMIAKHKVQREAWGRTEAERAKAREVEEDNRHTRNAEEKGIHKGAYLVAFTKILGRVTAWPQRNGMITTNTGVESLFAGNKYRGLTGRDFPFDIPVAVLKREPATNINEVIWDGQTFFVWSEHDEVTVVTAAGRKLAKDSEIAKAVLTSQVNKRDETIDAAVAKLAKEHSLRDWTPFTISMYSEPLKLEAIAPARRGKDLVGFQVRGKGEVYQRMAKPKNGFLWVRQQ